MIKKDDISILNLAGSICSIIALLLTLSGNLALRNIFQIVFGVVGMVGICGLVFRIANSLWSYYFNIDFWAIKLLYWLFVLILGMLIAGGVGLGIYYVVDVLMILGKSALKFIIT